MATNTRGSNPTGAKNKMDKSHGKGWSPPSGKHAPPPAGAHKPPADQAQNSVQAIPKSAWSERPYNSSGLTSANPGPSGPFQSDSSSWPEWLDPKNARPAKTDTSGGFFK